MAGSGHSWAGNPLDQSEYKIISQEIPSVFHKW